MGRLDIYLNSHGVVQDDVEIVKNSAFSNLLKGINTFNPDVVTLKSFINEDGKEIRYFWFNAPNVFEYNKTVRKPSSRSAMFNNLEKFEIEPWNQILVDTANVYGSAVDDNIEEFYSYGLRENTMEETIMSISNMKDKRLVWVGRSVMVCHPEGYVYGEIDELLYSPEIDTYFVGDTKTSSSVVKGAYAYQLATYIEILRMLNPDKKFAPLGLINWVKIKDKKWVINKEFNEEEWKQFEGMDSKEIKESPVYTAKWPNRVDCEKEYTESMIAFDLDAAQMTNLVRADWFLIYKLLPQEGYFAHASTLEHAIKENEVIAEANRRIQDKYREIKTKIESDTTGTIVINCSNRPGESIVKIMEDHNG